MEKRHTFATHIPHLQDSQGKKRHTEDRIGRQMAFNTKDLKPRVSTRCKVRGPTPTGESTFETWPDSQGDKAGNSGVPPSCDCPLPTVQLSLQLPPTPWKAQSLRLQGAAICSFALDCKYKHPVCPLHPRKELMELGWEKKLNLEMTSDLGPRKEETQKVRRIQSHPGK